VVQKQLEPKSLNVPTWLLWLLFMIGFYLSSYPSCINIKKTIYGVLYFPWLNNEVFYHVIGAFIIMFVIVNSQKVQSALSGKILNYIGKISFSFYLLHFIILCSLSCFLFKLFFMSYEYNSSVILAFLCSLPVIAIMSIGYYKWIDKAGIKLSEKIVGILYSKTERL
jgi:peptidoglycan/LPS O-acetylase OafA/YrhL